MGLFYYRHYDSNLISMRMFKFETHRTLVTCK